MKNKKKRVREITDYIKFVFPMLVLYILFFIFVFKANAKRKPNTLANKIINITDFPVNSIEL